MQGIGKLSLVAQSAASVVQAGTKEITSKVYKNFRFVLLLPNDIDNWGVYMYSFCVSYWMVYM